MTLFGSGFYLSHLLAGWPWTICSTSQCPMVLIHTMRPTICNTQGGYDNHLQKCLYCSQDSTKHAVNISQVWAWEFFPGNSTHSELLYWNGLSTIFVPLPYTGKVLPTHSTLPILPKACSLLLSLSWQNSSILWTCFTHQFCPGIDMFASCTKQACCLWRKGPLPPLSEYCLPSASYLCGKSAR